MIDLSHVEQYRENNRIEAKKALGGLPKSIWETYSAFANTLGGILLLGVEELPDRELHAVDLPDPVRLVGEFRQLLNDPNKVSVNILSPQDISIVCIDGKHIISIEVPQAHRCDKPVYIDGSPMRGTYVRRGEGDFRCTPDEVRAMQRDAAVHTQDMQILPTLPVCALDGLSLRRFRAMLQYCRPALLRSAPCDLSLLLQLGAAAQTDAGLCLTAAGLLMFGRHADIIAEFPHYSLQYHRPDGSCLQSGTGDWSGNLFDFFCTVTPQLVPQASCARPGADAPVCSALREALINALVNADYHERGGISLRHTQERITISNPGGFRIDPGTAVSGGVSDPRNAALARMFRLIGAGSASGSGIPHMFSTWRGRGWALPTISVQPVPARTTLCLPLGTRPALSRRRRPLHVSGSAAATRQLRYAAIIAYLTRYISADSRTLADALGCSASTAGRCLAQLAAEGTVSVEDGPSGRRYRLMTK